MNDPHEPPRGTTEYHCVGCGRAVHHAHALCMVCQVHKRAETAKSAREVFQEMRDRTAAEQAAGGDARPHPQ